MKHIKFILFQNEKLSELKLTLIFITLLHYRTKVLVNICHQLCNNFYWNILAFALRKKFARTRWINRFCDTLTTASSSLKCLQKFPLSKSDRKINFAVLWFVILRPRWASKNLFQSLSRIRFIETSISFYLLKLVKNVMLSKYQNSIVDHMETALNKI